MFGYECHRLGEETRRRIPENCVQNLGHEPEISYRYIEWDAPASTRTGGKTECYSSSGGEVSLCVSSDLEKRWRSSILLSDLLSQRGNYSVFYRNAFPFKPVLSSILPISNLPLIHWFPPLESTFYSLCLAITLRDLSLILSKAPTKRPETPNEPSWQFSIFVITNCKIS